MNGTTYPSNGNNPNYSDGLTYDTVVTQSQVVATISVDWVSMGYGLDNVPLTIIAKSDTVCNFGLAKTGNAGADGGGSAVENHLFEGTSTTINNKSVWAWRRMISGTSDPAICDLYFFVADQSSTLPVLPAITAGTYLAGTHSSSSYAYMSNVANVLCVAMLLSERVTVTVAECEAVVTAMVESITIEPVVTCVSQ